MLPREQLRIKGRINAILEQVNRDNRGAQLVLSRTSPQMLTALMQKEVPEIAEQIIEIRDVARQPGLRAKISVKPMTIVSTLWVLVLVCVVPVSKPCNKELEGERIDVVVWSDDAVQYIISALEPADVDIILDEIPKRRISSLPLTIS